MVSQYDIFYFRDTKLKKDYFNEENRFKALPGPWNLP